MKPRNVVVRNSMQKYRYACVCKPGSQFDPRFTPALTPAQMLKLGVFEGKYLNDTQAEYPASWFVKTRLSDVPDASVNCFRRKSRLPLSSWKDRGWIHRDDPRGWFEWYCRYYMGRRHEDDERQIKRWRAFVRHSSQVLKYGNKDPNIRPVQRQALLQWSWDPFPDIRTRGPIFEKVVRHVKRLNLK